MKIMTYNIASGWDNHDPKARVRSYDFASDEIARVSPDICGLNEVGKRTIEGIPSHCDYLGNRLGMNRYFAPAIMIDSYPYGNAMLTKYRVVSAKTTIIPDPPRDEDEYYETRCVLECELETPELGVMTLLVSHFGLANGEKANAVKTVCEIFDRVRRDDPSRQIALTGDFNMTPDDKRLDCIRERMTEASRAAGNEQFSFPSDKPEIKIDYIFTTERFKVKSAEVLDTRASDHRPLTAEFDII